MMAAEFNMNESTIYINKVPLNRNTHQARLCIDLLVKMLTPEANRNLILHFLQEQGFSVR